MLPRNRRLKIEKFIELTNCSFLRIHWRLSTILKTSKKLYEVVLSGMQKYVYSESIFNTLYIEMIRNVKKIFSDKINSTKNALLFLWRALTHPSFTFPLSYFYELKYKVCLSKTVCGIFHFQFRFVFIKVYNFAQQNAWTLWLYNVIIPLKIKTIYNPSTVLFPDL